MEEFFMTIWSAIANFTVTFYNSKIFFVIKIFLAIYTAVLIVDVILLAYLSDVRKKLRGLRKGDGTTKTTKRGDKQRWEEIVGRLKSDDEKQYRAAILEADQFVYKSLELQGYSGANFSERLAQIPAGSFNTLDMIRDAHGLSKKIIYDEEMRVTEKQTTDTLNVYKSFLQEIDVL